MPPTGTPFSSRKNHGPRGPKNKVSEKICEICVICERKEKIVLRYEKQGILEDGDSGHRDGADGTDHHTGSIQLYVTFTPRELLKTLGGYFHLNHEGLVN